MRVIDDYLGVYIRRVDPLAAEVLREETLRLDLSRHLRRNDHFLGAIRRRIQRLTCRIQRLRKPLRLILSRQHAPELVVRPLGRNALIRYGRENVPVLVDPVAQAVVERLGVDRADQILARGVPHAEALIHGLKGRARLRTRDQLRGRVVANALAGLFELVSELVGAVDGAAALLRLVGLVEQGDEAGRGRDLRAQLGEALFGVVVAAASANLENAPGSVVDLDALTAVFDGARCGSVVHLPVPFRDVEALGVEALEGDARALLVRLEAESAGRVARSARACFAAVLFAPDRAVFVHVGEGLVAVLVRVELADDLVGQVALGVGAGLRGKREEYANEHV